MNKTLIRTITFLVGGLSLIVGGLIYVLITDLYLLNTSSWLFLAIFPSLGSGIGFILADNIKKELFWRYFVKGLCLALGIAFIYVLFRYNSQFILGSAHYDESVVSLVIKAKHNTTAQVVGTASFATAISLVFGFAGVIAEATSIVFDVIFKVED